MSKILRDFGQLESKGSWKYKIWHREYLSSKYDKLQEKTQCLRFLLGGKDNDRYSWI